MLKPANMTYINADEIQAALGCDNKTAAEIADKRRESALEARQDFCFETVMSTDRKIKFLRRAREAGYFIRCYYILTADPQINVLRVASRVASGGHDVPEDKIIARYDRALELVRDLVPICDVCYIYDNTNKPYRIFKKRKEQCWYCVLPSLWHKADIVALTGVPDPKRRALNQ